jgi:hypothetical protein
MILIHQEVAFMGMFREVEAQEPDLIKEMAESLGSAGARLEELLEKLDRALPAVAHLKTIFIEAPAAEKHGAIEDVRKAIREYNLLVDRAENALAWLLIQREACGFRTHKNVHVFYPIPPKIKPFTP